MMPTISMSVWRRPEYTAMVLDALRQNIGAEKYRLVVAVDCVGRSPHRRVLDIVKRQTWPEKLEIVVMPGHCGCNRTIKAALDAAFADADYVIHVEDDVLLARDALAWFEWCQRYRDDNRVWTATAWRHDDGWQPDSSRALMPDEHCLAKRHSFMNVWGWATWRHRYEQMAAEWTQSDDMTLSWDVQLRYLRERLGLYEISPMISRAVNIGSMLGTHRGHHPLPFWRADQSFDTAPEFAEIPTPDDLPPAPHP